MEKTVEEIVEVFDEDKLKSYLEKDNSVEELLTSKIEELKAEKGKLSDKESELEELESSYRDKLTRDVSTDELRNIADEIDKIKLEVGDINNNIEKLESELNDMIETKKQTEKTKEDYITIVSKTISEYEKKLEAIDNAIKVCDNDALKSAYEEEKSKMQNELTDLRIKREVELDRTILASKNNKLLNDATMTLLKNISELRLSDINKVSNDDIKKEFTSLTDAEIQMLRNISNLNFGGFDTFSNNTIKEVVPILTDAEITMLKNISELHLGSLDSVNDKTIKSAAPLLGDNDISLIRNISDLRLNDFSSLSENNIKLLLPTLNTYEIKMLKTISDLKLGTLSSAFDNSKFINDCTLKIVENISKLSREKNRYDKPYLNEAELRLLKNISLIAAEKNPEIEIPMPNMQIEDKEESIDNIIEKLKQEINTENLSPAFDEVSVSDIDLPDLKITPDINLNSKGIDINSIINVNDIKGKMVINNTFVPAEQVGDIFRSSSIMPLVYDKLDNFIVKNKEAM